MFKFAQQSEPVILSWKNVFIQKKLELKNQSVKFIQINWKIRTRSFSTSVEGKLEAAEVIFCPKLIENLSIDGHDIRIKLKGGCFGCSDYEHKIKLRRCKEFTMMAKEKKSVLGYEIPYAGSAFPL